MTQTSMPQTGIPFLFLRGGSSRGPYMNRADLPADLDRLADVLVAAVGSGHPLNIDGLAMREHKAAPTHGQHSSEVLQELGYTPEQVAQMRQEGVI